MNLTPARGRALRTIAQAEADGRLVRVSNQTTPSTVYWQSANWLFDQQFIVYKGRDYGDALALTDAGREVAAAITTAAS